jgi:DME family drug/metabolite transporter
LKSFDSSALAWGGVLLAGALWGAGAIVAHGLMAAGLSFTDLALWRFLLGLPLLWWLHRRWRVAAPPAERAAGRWRALGRSERLCVIGTGAATALAVACWFAGIARLGAGLPTLISICLAPVIVAAISLLRGYERADARLLSALGLGLAGVLFMAWPTLQGPGHAVSAGTAKAAVTAATAATAAAAGIAWSVASAFAQAMVVLGNARMPRQVPAVTASAWGMTVAALCMLTVALTNGALANGPGVQGSRWPAGPWFWLGLAYTGVVTTSVAYLLFAWGARRLTPTAANVGIMVEPLVALLLGALLLGEAIAGLQWLGAVLLVAAVALLAWRRRVTPPAGRPARSRGR